LVAVFLFDTDHLVILQGQSTDLCQWLLARIRAYAPQDFLVSIVSFQEQVAGWLVYLGRKREAKQIVHAYQQFGRLLSEYSTAQIADFDEAAAKQFDELRRQRVRIGTMDLRIASIALVSDYTVLTRNIVDFEKVPGLKVEDWTVAASEKPR
jgi:tRNA(fMet)-specific endonuclease VapC